MILVKVRKQQTNFEKKNLNFKVAIKMNLFSRVRSECPSQISSHRTFADSSLARQNQNLDLNKVIFFIFKVYLMFDVSESILNFRNIHIGRGFFARST